LRADFFHAMALGFFHGQYRPVAFRAAFFDWRIPQCIVAFGVFGAGIEYFAVTGFAFEDGAFFALWAFNAGICRFFDRLDVPTFWVVAATDEFAVATGFEHQGRFAFGADAAFHNFRLIAGSAIVV